MCYTDSYSFSFVKVHCTDLLPFIQMPHSKKMQGYFQPSNWSKCDKPNCWVKYKKTFWVNIYNPTVGLVHF